MVKIGRAVSGFFFFFTFDALCSVDLGVDERKETIVVYCVRRLHFRLERSGRMEMETVGVGRVCVDKAMFEPNNVVWIEREVLGV